MKDETMPIAIVGLSCRLPGAAADPEGLWHVCAEQHDVWQPIPNQRLDNGAFFHPDPGRNGTSNVRGGHFLHDDPGVFDAAFFNLTAVEARAMDPQQRILLELSYEALENAGIALDKASGTDTAVFVGSSCRDYADLLQRDPQSTELFQATGVGQTMLSDRISYFYDFKGPSVTVDTACSSSLNALHLACNALRLGEASMAVVGGSNLILSHEPMISLSMLRFLSPDGRCYTYDQRANGFGRGEGASCLILKPFQDAYRDGDIVRAVIRNSGANQDGRTVGISLPSGDAQIELIERTYRAAGLDPAQTSFVEAHGTGTPAGDPIEAASLSKVFSRQRSVDQPLHVGSVKSNIGHLEGASGVAGVVKTVLMLENNLILPNFNFQDPSDRIPMDELRIKVPTYLQAWPTEKVHRASVNNFGFGGSNAHVIIDDARGYMASRGLTGKYRRPIKQLNKVNGIANGDTIQGLEKERQVFVLSAFSELSGKRQAKALGVYLDTSRVEHPSRVLVDLAFTLSDHRSVWPWKAAFSATSLSQLAEAVTSDSVRFTRSPRAKGLGFVFTGQGAQWHAMGRELIGRYPVFQRSLDLADQHLRVLGAPWSLSDEILKDVGASNVHSTYLSQPMTTAIQMALVDLFASWSIRPARVTGHSSGEIAAAYCAGALTRESALAVAYHRGRLAMKIKGFKDGAMLAVGLSEETAKSSINELTQGSVKVACVNSPSSVTVSGDRAAIVELLVLLQYRGISVRVLAVEVAYHSHHMEDIADEYLASLATISVKDDSTIEFYSSVSGKRVPNSDLGPGYWVSNMVNTVQFSDSLQRLLRDPDTRSESQGNPDIRVDTLVEIGPHSALQAPIKQILQHDPKLKALHIQYVSALVRNTSAICSCHNVVAQLFVKNYPVNLKAVNLSPGSKTSQILVDLPPYTWNHSSSYWAASVPQHGNGMNSPSRDDILGVKATDSTSLEPRWRNIVRPSEVPWVNDHVVQSNILYPAAGFLAMAVEAEHQRRITKNDEIRGYNLREITIGHALVIPRNANKVETMISLRLYSESLRVSSDIWDEFCVSSSVDGSSWTENCRGLISVQKATETTEVDGGRQNREESDRFCHMISDFETNCTTNMDTQEMYKALDGLGLSFGPLFTNMRRARFSADKCIAEISIPNTLAAMPAQFEYPLIVHPATLDSCFHSVFPIGARYSQRGQGTPVPTFIEEMFLSQSIKKSPGHIFDVYAQSEEKLATDAKGKGGGQRSDSLAVFDRGQTNLQPKITIKGLVFTYIAKDSSDANNGDEHKICYQTVWNTDPSFLSPAQAIEMSAEFRQPFPQADQTFISQQASFYYAERVLKTLSAEDISAMQLHHQKLCKSLTGFCNAVRVGQLGPFSTLGWLDLDSEQRAIICARVAHVPYGIVLCNIGESLSRILRQEIDSLSVLQEEDRLERFYRTWEPFHQSYKQAAVFIKLLGIKNPHLNILEIGAGTGGATQPILEALINTGTRPPNFTNYDFTDVSSDFFEKSKEKLGRWSDVITFKKFDIEHDPIEQGYQPGSYDLIIAANVMHTTSCVKSAMERAKSLLKPGGSLVLIELTVKTLANQLMFGTLPGWWNAEEESRADGPLLTEKQWDDMLHDTGFTGANTFLWDMPDLDNHHCSIIIATVPVENRKMWPAITIVTDTVTSAPYLNLQHLLARAGMEHHIASLSDCNPSNQICIVLCELTRPVLRNPSPRDFAAIKRIFLESDGVLWVTHGALMESINPDLNLVAGLARTVRLEKGNTIIVTLDLDAQASLSGPVTAENIFSVLMTSFGKKDIGTTDIENEYAERNGAIMIPRIVEDEHLDPHTLMIKGLVVPELQSFYQTRRPLKAEIRTPGLLDSIQFVDDHLISGNLPDHSVEVEVKASGINFRDVMTALGQIARFPLGCECSGVVSAVGKMVEDFRPGDRVIATVKSGSFCNVIRAPAEEVEPIPHDLSFEIAAALPVAYFTAYWAVFKVARLCKDESVLIHAGSGGLGQALISLCQFTGAKVFATVGTLEKKHLLMAKYNIAEDNIFSSRDSTFYKGVMTMTQGRGVDVIMNSLSGEALRLTWNCIAPFGRFVELGKRDFTINSRLEMRNFEKNVSFTGLDVPLDSQLGEKRRIWREIMTLYQKGFIRAPWPVTVFGMSELEKALRTMQSGKHMGKMILKPQLDEMVKVTPSTKNSSFLREDASYLLIGGLGGIGRATASWMLRHGARNFIFASPSGSEKQKAKETVALLKEQGAQVSVFKCDISNIEDLDQLLEHSRLDMPPIRGVIHGALVAKPELFERMSLQDYNDVMRPKIDGIWNLHNRLPKSDLDFFIMLSSLVGRIGDPSQAAYAAASVFQDAFADYRSRQGLPAVTLDLGKVVDIGIVAERFAVRRALMGVWSRDLREEEVMNMIKSAIITPLRTQGSGSPIIGLKAWSPKADPIFQAPMFSHFRRAAIGRSPMSDMQGSTIPHIRETLRQAKSLKDATDKICDELRLKLSSLLMIPVEDVRASKSMLEHGMDSLVAVEMRNWLLRELNSAIPILELMANVSLSQLSVNVAKSSKLVSPDIILEDSDG